MYKLTIDIGLMTEGISSASMAKLLKWKEAGLVELIEAGAVKKTEPVAPPPKPTPARQPYQGSNRGRSTPIAGSGNATFKTLAGILFPDRDSAKLRMSEINNVVYLIKHHSTKNDIFVTANTKNYIENGHQERLKSAFGILAMTPEETVRTLSKMVGASASASAAR